MTAEQPKMPDMLGAVGLRPKKNNPDKIYASFNRRMVAATIDSCIAALVLAPLVDFLLPAMVPIDIAQLQQQLAGEADPQARQAILHALLVESGALQSWFMGALAQTGALLAATALCWKRWSATPGKLLLRMKIVDAASGVSMSDRQILLRIAGYFVACGTFFLGIIWIGFDKRRQGWHDKMADTVVVNVAKKN